MLKEAKSGIFMIEDSLTTKIANIASVFLKKIFHDINSTSLPNPDVLHYKIRTYPQSKGYWPDDSLAIGIAKINILPSITKTIKKTKNLTPDKIQKLIDKAEYARRTYVLLNFRPKNHPKTNTASFAKDYLDGIAIIFICKEGQTQQEIIENLYKYSMHELQHAMELSFELLFNPTAISTTNNPHMFNTWQEATQARLNYLAKPKEERAHSITHANHFLNIKMEEVEQKIKHITQIAKNPEEAQLKATQLLAQIANPTSHEIALCIRITQRNIIQSISPQKPLSTLKENGVSKQTIDNLSKQIAKIASMSASAYLRLLAIAVSQNGKLTKLIEKYAPVNKTFVNIHIKLPQHLPQLITILQNQSAFKQWLKQQKIHSKPDQIHNKRNAGKIT